jgi:hypothetical protein
MLFGEMVYLFCDIRVKVCARGTNYCNVTPGETFVTALYYSTKHKALQNPDTPTGQTRQLYKALFAFPNSLFVQVL